MSLARVKTVNPGDTILSADWNNEFNNILNNPITLISPTTGAINFQTSVAHTNLTPTAISASSGTVGQVLTITAALTPIWGAPFFTNVSAMSSSQTFNVSAGVGRLLVELWGGGGGGGGSSAGSESAGGGGGGYALGLYTVTSSQSYTVTIGAGGAGGPAGGGAGTAGGNSAFGTLTSAGGGAGGPSGPNTVGAGGVGSGGDLNFIGQTGAPAIATSGTIGGAGGDAPRGGSGGYGFAGGGGGGITPGGGGGGGGAGSSGGTGAPGLCVVRF